MENQVYFFKSSWAGKIGKHVFEQEGVVNIITDEKVANAIRANNFFKRGIVVELTEDEIKEAKAQEAEALSKTTGLMTPAEFERKVQAEVAARLLATQQNPSKEDQEAIKVAKEYLDMNGIKYHPNTGLAKLEEKVQAHQLANKN